MPKIDIGDAEIYYEERGSGPPLLLVPGLGGGGAWWRHQVEAFSPHFRVIIHDHRGAGQSTHSLIEYSVDQMASDVIKLMDGLGLEAAHYAGHSTGGAIGQTLAQDHPDRLLSLVLSATWPGPDAYFRRSFEMRKEILETLGIESYTRASMLMLMPPWWIAENDAAVEEQAKMRAATESPERRARSLAEIEVGRFGEPEDIAAAAIYLASDAGSFVNGAFLDVHGGT